MDRQFMVETGGHVLAAHSLLTLLEKLVSEPGADVIIAQAKDHLSDAMAILRVPSSRAAYMREYRLRQKGLLPAPSAPPEPAPAPDVVYVMSRNVTPVTDDGEVPF